MTAKLRRKKLWNARGLVLLMLVSFGALVCASKGMRMPALQAAAPSASVSSLGAPAVEVFGGSGDQAATSALVVGTSALFVGTDAGELRQFPLPFGPATDTSSTPGLALLGLAASGGTIHAAGYATPSACGASDSVGGVEPKSALARYDASSVARLGCSSVTLFPYSGYENYKTIVEMGSSLFAAGTAETCGFGHNTFILSRLDASGSVLQTVGEPGVDFQGFSCTGGSNVGGVAALNGSVYAAGFSRQSGEDGVNRPGLTKFDAVLNLLWKVRPLDHEGEYQAVAASNGAIYAVGYAVVNGRYAALIEKFDEGGTRVWTQVFPGTGDDILYGVAAAGNRLVAVGSTSSLGAGGNDVLVLEVDPATGVAQSTTTWGGAGDDGARAVALSGNDLFVAGSTRSFGSSAGNTVGESDAVVLHYALPAAISSVTIDSLPQGLAVVVDGAQVVTPQTYPWTVGSNHTVDVVTPQQAGATSRARFDRWSDGGPQAHTITVPTGPVTYTATFVRQHNLAWSVNPVGSGTIVLNPATSDGYYDEGSNVSVDTVANPGSYFVAFSGDLSGASRPQTLAMSAPRTVTANFAGCTFAPTPTSLALGPAAGTGSVAINTAGSCAWTATSNANWLRITSATSGTGPTTVSIAFGSNTTGTTRTTTLSVGGVSIPVSQAACSYSVSPTSKSFSAAGGSGTVNVTTQAGCGWTASSSASWLTVTSGTSGSGSGTVRYSVASNSGVARKGTLTAAGIGVPISQAAPVPTFCGATEVTSQISVTRSAFRPSSLGNFWLQDITLTSNSGTTIPGPIYLVMDGLPKYDAGVCRYGCGVVPAQPLTRCLSSSGAYLVLYSSGTMAPGQSITKNFAFAPYRGTTGATFQFTPRVLSGKPNK